MSVQMSILIIFGKIARFIALKYTLNTMISFKKPFLKIVAKTLNLPTQWNK